MLKITKLLRPRAIEISTTQKSQDLHALTPCGSRAVRILATVSAAGLVIASAGFGAIFAWQTGSQHGPILGALTVLMAVALETAKPLAVAGAFASLRSFAIGRGVALALLATVAIVYSLASELALVATSRGDIVAERAAGSKAAHAIDGQRARIEAELDALGITRPSAAIVADLDSALTDRRLSNCDGWLANVKLRTTCIETVAPLRAELAKAQRREKLEADLSALQVQGSPPVAKAADPAAHALSVYLAALGFAVPTGTLTDWLVLIPVLALEVGAATAALLVQAAGPVRTPVRTQPLPAPVSAIEAVPSGAVHAAQPAVSTKANVDSKTPAVTAPKVSTRRALGQAGKASKATAETAVVDTLKARGGRLPDASVRGLAALLSVPKSTVHNALAALIATGAVAKIGTELVLRA